MEKSSVSRSYDKSFDVKKLKAQVSRYCILLKNERIKNRGLEFELSNLKKPMPEKIYKAS